MSLLFDTSPSEDGKQRRKPRRRQGPEPIQSEVEPSVSIPAFVAPKRTLGAVDEGVACADESCGAACHDIVEADRGWWNLECCFCGTGQWIKAIDNRLDAKKETPKRDASEVFVFPEGQRFGGKTINEVFAVKPEHVRWAAQFEQDSAVRKACQTWLDAREAAL